MVLHFSHVKWWSMAAEASPNLPDRAVHDLADPVLVLDPRTLRVVGANHRAGELLGYDFPDLQSMPIADIHPLDEDRIHRFVGETLRDSRARVEETSCFTAESQFVPAEVVGSAVRHEGRPRVLVVVHDLRQREQFGLREELERVRTVTRAFVGDIRAALSPVRAAVGGGGAEKRSAGAGGSAVEAGGAEQTSADADGSGDEPTVALAHVDRILDELVVVVGEPTDPGHERVLLSQAVNDAWMQVDSGHASIEVHENVAFAAHRDSLLRMLGNLFENAIQHGGDAASIEVGVVGPGNGFYVQHDGPGLRREERDRLFSGAEVPTDDHRFGLLVVERLVEAHGWDIRVEESPTGEVRFVVRF